MLLDFFHLRKKWVVVQIGARFVSGHGFLESRKNSIRGRKAFVKEQALQAGQDRIHAAPCP
jgi:hypothetical protein